MTDASSPKPLINDSYAKMLMGDEGMKYWQPFKDHPNPNGSNIARCFIIDTWVREAIAADRATTVILVGAGLDSRAFRFDGGTWIELDEPGIIEYKNTVLPASQCRNQLQRISIDFEKEKLEDKLKPFTNAGPVVFVVEGVLMYLTVDQRKELLKTITSLFRKHALICDLMNANFFQKVGKRGIYEELIKLNAPFKDLVERPEQLMIDAGYTQEAMKSNVITAADLGLLTIPRFLVKFLMKKVFMGYSSYKFKFDALQPRATVRSN